MATAKVPLSFMCNARVALPLLCLPFSPRSYKLSSFPQIATPSEHRSARIALLEKEKNLTRARDALAAERRNLPIVEVTKPYTFTALDASGKEMSVTLLDLFGSNRQLIVYHFMFDPAWDAGCSSCSFFADHIPPLEVSSHGNDFNFDFHVSQDANIAPVEYNYRNEDEIKAKGLEFQIKGEMPGHSCFVKGGNGVGEEGKVYHTYSSYARGGDGMLGTYMWLDMTFLGRQDGKAAGGLGFPRRDEYEKRD
jgi:predicted dithiol-disulfide oxidoreductase (DUF899 family)